MKWTPKNYADWHRWFAWFPVMVNGQAVWLEYVERRYEYIGWDYYKAHYR